MEIEERRNIFHIVGFSIVLFALVLIMLMFGGAIFFYSDYKKVSYDDVDMTLKKSWNSYEIVNLNDEGVPTFEGIVKSPVVHEQGTIDIVFHGEHEIMTISSFIGPNEGDDDSNLFELTMNLYCCPLSLKGSEYTVSEDCTMVLQGIVMHLAADSKEVLHDRLKTAIDLTNRNPSQAQSQCGPGEFLNVDLLNIFEVEEPQFMCRGFCREGEFETFLEMNKLKVEELSNQKSGGMKEAREYLRDEIFIKQITTCRDTSTQGAFAAQADGKVTSRVVEENFFEGVLQVFCSGFSVSDQKTGTQYSGICVGDHFGLSCERKQGMITMGSPVEERR